MQNITNLISNFSKNDEPEIESLNYLITKIDFKIDEEFLEFYKKFDGMEGYLVNSDIFIMFWKIEEIISLNPYFEEVPICDELMFFGTDGSSLGYAIDKKNSKFVSIDFYEIMEIAPTFIANSFFDFLNR